MAEIDPRTVEMLGDLHFHGPKTRHTVYYGRDLSEAAQHLARDVGEIDDEVTIQLLSARFLGHVTVQWDGREGEQVEAWEFEYWPTSTS